MPSLLFKPLFLSRSITVINHIRKYSTESFSLTQQFQNATNPSLKHTKYPCTTKVTDPREQGIEQESLFYKIQKEDVDKFLEKSLPFDYQRLTSAFNEHCLMIRKPALKVINCLKKTDFSAPTIRYILYGKEGTGKTTSMAHILHYASKEDFLILHVPWAGFWSKHFKEWTPSTWNEERIDMSVEALEWLVHFHKMNSHLLLDDLTIEGNYTWSKREKTESGSSLGQLINLAVDRTKYSCDIVGVLLKEIKLLASNNKLKVLVAIDGVNSFWHKTRISLPYGNIVPASRLSLVHNFKKLLKNDWCGGAVVCTIDPMSNPRNMRASYLPAYLLTKEGFHHMEPFIPVKTTSYSNKEMQSCLDYYFSNNWIQVENADSEEGRSELAFLSQKNPRELVNVLRGW